jgi:hypothetical protein
MNQRKFQDPEIPFPPLLVLQIASCQSARYKIKKGGKEEGVRRGKEKERQNDADRKSGEYMR